MGNVNSACSGEGRLCNEDAACCVAAEKNGKPGDNLAVDAETRAQQLGLPPEHDTSEARELAMNHENIFDVKWCTHCGSHHVL